MDFRRRDQRDERRRRVLLEEMRGSDDDGDQTATSPGSSEQAGSVEVRSPRSYSEAAFVSRQPAVTCVVPRRLWTLTCLFLLCLVFAAGIEALYVQLLLHVPARLREPLAALDATASGSLASWFSALVLFSAAAYSVLIFHLRRHKLDDFRARYRVWIPAALGLIAASLDVATGLHDVAAAWLVEATKTTLYGDGSVWWLLTVGGVFLLLAGRLMFELRESRLAAAMLGSAGFGYSAAITMELELWPALRGETIAGVAQSSVLLGSHICTLFAVLGYVRFVYLDSQGDLQARQAQAKRSEPEKEPRQKKSSQAPVKAPVPKVTKRATIRVDDAHDAPRKSKVKESGRPAGEAVEEESDQVAAGTRKLSKAERRRQRKLMRQQKRN